MIPLLGASQVCKHNKSQQKVVRDYFSLSANQYGTNYRSNGSFRERLDIVANLVVNQNYNRALDAGCGTGEYLSLLKNVANFVHGLDFSAQMIKEAKERITPSQNIRLTCSSIELFSSNEIKYDLIISIGVIEYSDQPSLLLRHLRSLCFSEATLILSFPNIFNPSRIKDRITSRPLEFILRKLNIPIPKHIRKNKSMSYTQVGYIKHKEYSMKAMSILLRTNGFKALEFYGYNGSSFEKINLLSSGLIVKAIAVDYCSSAGTNPSDYDKLQ